MTKDLLLHFSTEMALGAGVFPGMVPPRPRPSIPRPLLLRLDLQQAVRGVCAVVVQEQQVNISGGERALVAQVSDGGSGRGRRWSRISSSRQQKQSTMRTGAFPAGEGVGDFAQVLLRCAEPTRAERAMFNSAFMNAVSPLVVMQKRGHNDNFRPVCH